MKPRTLLILLALVVGIGAFVWFFEREQPGSEEREKLANRVLGVERQDIVRLELTAGDRTVELVRTHEGTAKSDDGAAEDAAAIAAGGAPPVAAADDQDEWRLRRPVDFPADYWQVDALVRTLAELARTRELLDYDAKEVGLDPPRGRVVVELEGGKKKELLIGSEVPGSGNLIVAVEGEPGASVVAGSLWESLEKDGAAWRDQDLFAPEREEIAAMTLERAGTDAGEAARVKLTRAGDDFELVEPMRDRADADAINALVRELTGLRASEFLDSPPPLASIGLDPPRATLTVELTEGAPFVLLWGDRKEGAQESYAKVGDLVVTTAAALDESLDRGAAEWRSKSWSSMPVFDIDRVEVSYGTGSLELVRDEGSWRRGEESIQYGPVSDFLYAIEDAAAERIAEPGEITSLGPPEMTVTFSTHEASDHGKAEPTSVADSKPAASPAESEQLELYAPTSENLVPARAAGRDAVVLLRRETRDQILAKLQAVRDAEPATEDPTPAADPGSPPE